MIPNAFFENLHRLGKEHAAQCKAHEALKDRETLRKAGFQSFVYSNQSTAVMQNIHQFVAAGCTLEGPCTLVKKSKRWGEETEEQVIGLRFHL